MYEMFLVQQMFYHNAGYYLNINLLPNWFPRSEKRICFFLQEMHYTKRTKQPSIWFLFSARIKQKTKREAGNNVKSRKYNNSIQVL